MNPHPLHTSKLKPEVVEFLIHYQPANNNQQIVVNEKYGKAPGKAFVFFWNGRQWCERPEIDVEVGKSNRQRYEDNLT